MKCEIQPIHSTVNLLRGRFISCYLELSASPALFSPLVALLFRRTHSSRASIRQRRLLLVPARPARRFIILSIDSVVDSLASLIFSSSFQESSVVKRIPWVLRQRKLPARRVCIPGWLVRAGFCVAGPLLREQITLLIRRFCGTVFFPPPPPNPQPTGTTSRRGRGERRRRRRRRRK